jgi:hypothetical protein
MDIIKKIIELYETGEENVFADEEADEITEVPVMDLMKGE